MLFTIQVFAGSVSFTSNITSTSPLLSSYSYPDSTPYIITNGGNCSSPSSGFSTGGNVYYQTQQFYVDQDGLYSFSNNKLSGETIRKIYIHCNLDTSDLKSNILASNTTTNTQMDLNNVPLKANTTYSVTIIPNANYEQGSYNTLISGPGNVFLASASNMGQSIGSELASISSNNAKSVSSSSKAAKNVVSSAFSTNNNLINNNLGFNYPSQQDFTLTPKLNINPEEGTIDAEMKISHLNKYFGSVSYSYEFIEPSNKSVLDKSGFASIVNLSLGTKLDDHNIIGFSIAHDNSKIDNKTSSSKSSSEGNLGALFYAYKYDDNVSFIVNGGYKKAKHVITSDNFSGEYKVTSTTLFAEGGINYSDAVIEDQLYLTFDLSSKYVKDKYDLTDDAGTGRALAYDEITYGTVSGGFELRAFEFDNNLNVYQPYFGASFGKFFDYTKRNATGDDVLDSDLKSAIENEYNYYDIYAGLDYNYHEIHTISGKVYLNKVEGNEPYVKGISFSWAIDF